MRKASRNLSSKDASLLHVLACLDYHQWTSRYIRGCSDAFSADDPRWCCEWVWAALPRQVLAHIGIRDDANYRLVTRISNDRRPRVEAPTLP